MSWQEYVSLVPHANLVGKYHLFTFTLCNSSDYPNDVRSEIQKDLIEIIQELYRRIGLIEEDTFTKITVYEKNFVHFGEKPRFLGLGLLVEPFVFNNSIGVTVYRDSIDTEVVYDLFDEVKDASNPGLDFNKADCYYETNDYSKGLNKFFRGYAISYLVNKQNKVNKKGQRKH